MEYQNPGFQWAKLILGVLILFGLGIISYKVVQRTEKNIFETGASSLETHRNDWPLSIHLFEGGCSHMGGKRENTNRTSP